MRIGVGCAVGEPDSEVTEIRGSIAFACAPFVQGSDCLQQARDCRECTGSKELGLGASSQILDEPFTQSSPALQPHCESRGYGLAFGFRICGRRVVSLSPRGRFKKLIDIRSHLVQQRCDLRRTRHEITNEALEIVDEARLESHDR